MSTQIDEEAATMAAAAEEERLLVERINAEIMAESGVELEQLINPSKVVNLERELITLSTDLATTVDASEREKIQTTIDKKRSTLAVEKRAVMTGWLKNLFVGQSVIALVISFAIVSDWVETPLAVHALGFWMWWLFIVPSLRYYHIPTNRTNATICLN
jgi:hypothetical protein